MMNSTKPTGSCGATFRQKTQVKALLAITGLSLILNFAFYATPFSVAKCNCDLHKHTIKQINEVSENLSKLSNVEGNSELKRKVDGEYQKLNKALGTLQSMDISAKSPTVQETPDVCPEKYAFKDYKGGYPVYYKGYEMVKCDNAPKFHTVLTLVYNFVHYNSDDLSRVSTIIHEVNRLYPLLNTIAAVPSTLKLKAEEFKNTVFVSTDVSESEPNIWNQLVGEVKTKYLYIGRNVVHFTWFDRLERLVRQIKSLNAHVAAGSLRTLHSGQWSYGCDQSRLYEYNLEYRHGYATSKEECLFCHHVHGPFVAKTEFLKKNALPEKMTGVSSFALWFLRLKELGDVVSCPDAMSFVTDTGRQPTTKDDWKGLARSLQVERVYPRPGHLIEFSCAEANVKCSSVKRSGLALSYCCKKELIDGIKLVMKKCQEEGMICEAQAGTMLGIVKFNSVLPWELDADIKLHYDNFTAFSEKLKPFFTSLGYEWKTGLGHMPRYGYHELYTTPSAWKIELYTYTKEEMGLITLHEYSPTLVELDGAYVRMPESPGLFARNCFGPENYQHVQHYTQVGIDAKTFYGTKQFKKCPTPGRHNCLDKFSSDGNMMFNYPLT